MLIIQNIKKLENYKDENISISDIQLTYDNTYEINFTHSSVVGWEFTYVLHRDTSERNCWVGTIRYKQDGYATTGSHREDCSKTRLTEMDGFIQLLDAIVIEFKFKHHI